ncbi:PAP/fibrillin family protein [Pseudanabaena sp. PCC 6802]|uniref:PAP/fibrillin family protein n=1 Tax=Pseudanabaena sp. PCC 6802 TaxID=118173 RepID=UPI00035E11B1|nr:PAP/fibrillin family protein [Pseudanabaena sp. PCC 6802]
MNYKEMLFEAIAPVNRGLKMTDVQKQAIFAAIAYMEASNPTPTPTEAGELLTGNWRLLFTTSQELLGFERFPGIKLGQIYQCIRANEGKVYNVAEILGLPLLEGFVSVCASFTVVSAQRVNVKFERAVVGLQRLIGYTNVDEFVQLLQSGRKLRAIDFGIKERDRQGWLETTYLDTDLRISRGNEGSVFVLRKDRTFSVR